MYLEYVTRMAAPGSLFYCYENLSIQIHHFLRDDLRCVFTFDGLQNSPETDLIVPLLQKHHMSQKELHIMGLRLLHLDIFPGYQDRFDFRVVCTGIKATFVLFKQQQLRVFEQAVGLWLHKQSITEHGDILKLLGTWDPTRPNTEKLLIHLLFAEVPLAFHMGNCRNDRVVSLFDYVDLKEHATYEIIDTIWNTFLRLWFTPRHA